MAVVRQILTAFPAQPDALRLAALSAQRMKQGLIALDYMEKAMRAAPGNAGFWNSLGQIHFRVGRLAESVEAFDKAIANAPKWRTSQLNKGTALWDQGRKDEVVRWTVTPRPIRISGLCTTMGEGSRRTYRGGEVASENRTAAAGRDVIRRQVARKSINQMLPKKHKVPPFLRIKIIMHSWIGKFLHGHPRVRKGAFRVGGFFHSIQDDYRRYGKKLDFERSIRHSGDVTAHGYTDRFGDVRSAINYGSHIHDPGFGPETVGEDYHLYEMEKKILRKLFENDPRIDVFLNFGVSYGYIDSIIAEENNNVSFFGIDLSEFNKALNEVEFSHVENLRFLCGDVFRFLEENHVQNGVLFHARTLLLLPEEFILKLYKECRKNGYAYIVGFEQFGLSQETEEGYEFSKEKRPSVYMEGRHVYPQLPRTRH